ncbi:MAG: amidohydrolase [Bacteroidetes bacterium]|nr:amidohydrolase [Bacteroidota bacterium]
MSRISCVLVILLLLSGCSNSDLSVKADLVLRGGKIATVDSEQPEAEAIAIKADTILAVGSNAEIAALVGSDTEIIELNGRLAIPGFIEGHGHFMGIGRAKMMLDLMSVRSWGEIVDMVAEAAEEAEPGQWIEGRGWHQEKWDRVPEGAVEGNPTHQTLSAVSPNNPVYLGHASGHAAFVNAEAMRLGGISAETPNPNGGEILHDARGEPTGMLRETAQRLVSRARSEARQQMTEEELETESRTRARLAADEVLSNGITSFHDAGVGFGTIDLFKELADAGELPVRLYVMARWDANTMADRIEDLYMVGYGDNHLTIRSIKQSLDGALGSHGAWLLEPYDDMPSSRGLNTLPMDSVRAVAAMAIANGFQLNIHAIGDRGNREVLDVYEQVFAANPDKTDLRWRIEHSQHLHPDDIPRFGQLGVIAAMQGIHCTSDAPWIIKRLGPKRAQEGAYVWQSLWETGATVANGTDAPVEKVSPIASYYATVSRKLADGTVFYPEQRLSREQALQSYTLNNAYAAFEEDIKGSLTVGKLADITVLSKDILTIEEDEIPTTEIVYTIVGGKVLYENPNSN